MQDAESIYNRDFLKWLAVESPSYRNSILRDVAEKLGYGSCGDEHAYEALIDVESCHIMDYFQSGWALNEEELLFDKFLESQN